MEYSVYDLIRILLKKWYIVLLVMCLIGGAAGVLSQSSYKAVLAEYEEYTSRTIPVNTEIGDFTAVYQCGFTMPDSSKYRESSSQKDDFIHAYLAENGTSVSPDKLYQEAEAVFNAIQSDFHALFTHSAVLASVQDFASQKGFTEPVVITEDGTVNDSCGPLTVSNHLSVTADNTDGIPLIISGLPEEIAAELASCYIQAVQDIGAELYGMDVSFTELSRAYVPRVSSFTEDALLSQTVMQKPEKAPFFLKAACKGAAYGFLFGCFGVLLYTFIRDTAPAEKARQNREKA